MPRLLGPRLELVPMTVAMLEARLVSTAALEALLRLKVAATFPLPETLEQFRQAVTTSVIDKHRAGDWGVHLIVSSETVIGLIGFKGPPDAGGLVELFYELVPEARGQGLCSEAVRGLTDWAFRNGASRTVAKSDPENVASKRVLERCGFALFAGPDARFSWFALQPLDADPGRQV